MAGEHICEGNETRRRRLAIALAACLALLALPAPSQGVTADEYRLKGAFLFNFAKFVKWPAESPAGRSENIRLCVLGDGNLVSVFDEIMTGRNAEGRRVAVRQIETTAGAGACDILFVAQDNDTTPANVVSATRGGHVLTVGESPGAAEDGLMINFTTESRKVRFEINADAARREGLTISSKLLRVATVVSETD